MTEEKKEPRTKEDLEKEYATLCNIAGDKQHRLACLESDLIQMNQHMFKIRKELAELEKPQIETKLEEHKNGENNA